jgi:hypothetical protein
MAAIAVVLANAHCFVRCLVQDCDHSMASCHSHGTSDTNSCPQQYALQSAPADTAASLALTSPAAILSGIYITSEQALENSDPLLRPATLGRQNSPLRI